MTSAVVGKNTPDLLSVGYRCQELGYGFHAKPYQVPYIVLPDGKTEVRLHVDQYVPYLLDGGDTAIHNSCVSMPCAASQSEIFDLDDDTSLWSEPQSKTIQIHEMFDELGRIECDALAPSAHSVDAAIVGNTPLPAQSVSTTIDALCVDAGIPPPPLHRIVCVVAILALVMRSAFSSDR